MLTTRRNSPSRTKRKRRYQKPLFSTFLGLILWTAYQLFLGLTHPELPKPGEPALFYSNQTCQDLKQTFLAAIGEANESILLIIYSLREPQVISLLRTKAEQGKNVVVICDAEASSSVNHALGPKVSTYYREGKGLMHQKILVVDEKQVWIGSANMTGESLHRHANLVMGVVNPDLATIVAAQANSMINATPPPRYATLDLNGQEGEIWFLPNEERGAERLQRMIESAKKTVRVAMFTWTHPALTQAVIKAHKRGIHVEAVIDRQSSMGASHTVFQQLRRAGISVTVNNTNSLLHHKMLIVDDTSIANGSANWTRAAFTHNDDCFLILKNLTASQKQFLEKLWRIIQLESTSD